MNNTHEQCLQLQRIENKTFEIMDWLVLIERRLERIEEGPAMQNNPIENDTTKAREERMRRKAASFELRLIKSRSRDPDAMDYGLYGLVDIRTNGMVNPSLIGRYACSWTLEQVEGYLTESELP